jgi:amino acid transporter
MWRRGGKMDNNVNTRPAAMDTAEHGLKKHNISVFTVVFMVFSLVAAGCYGIEDMLPDAGPGLALIMLMVLPFVWGLPFGLVASELGSVRPQEGGYYKWVQEALGEFWGFQAGWWRTISIYIDNTLYVILAGGYLGTLIHFGNAAADNTFIFAFKAVMILVFMWINIRGVRDVGWVTNVLSIFVILAFAMIAVVGFVNWGGNPFTPMTAEPATNTTDWVLYIGGGISVGMWMYSGYESMSTLAGELENPQVIPKATLITVPLIMATYILPTMAAISAFKTQGPKYSFDNWGTDPSSIGYATVAQHFLGYGFGVFFIVVAVVAQFSIYNTYIASGSRGFFALADDNLSPRFLVKTDKKHGVPYLAVISVSFVNMILCVLPFKVVIVVDVFMLVSSYIMVYISAMILRRRIPREEYKFRIPGNFAFLVVLCVVPMIVALLSFFINGSDYFIGGLIGITTGPIMYFFMKRIKGGLTKKDPNHFPANPRTRLAFGDTYRIAIIFGILTIFCVIASFFLPFFEHDWVYPDDYDMTLLGSKAAMWNFIHYAGVVTGVLTVVFALIGRVVEPKKNKKAA